MRAEVEIWVQYALQECEGNSAWQAANGLIRNVATRCAPVHFIALVPESVRIAMYLQTRNLPVSPDQIGLIESITRSAAFFAGLTEEQIAEKVEREHQERLQEIYDAVHAVHAYFVAHPLLEGQLAMAEAMVRSFSIGPYEGIVEQIDGKFTGPGMNRHWLAQRGVAKQRCISSPGMEAKYIQDFDSVNAYVEFGIIRSYSHGVAADTASLLTQVWKGISPVMFVRCQNKRMKQLLLAGLED